MQRPQKFLRLVFFHIVRVLVHVLLGLNIRRKHLLPTQSPAIVVANHNSHLDTLVLMSLFPMQNLPTIRPIAAADYFLKTRFMAWFATNIIGIIPIERGKANKNFDPLQPCHDALNAGNIIILFPEGTRGEPEKVSHFKKGIAHLVESHPTVPVIPVFLHGLGKALPKDDFVLIPFFCDVLVGEALTYSGDKIEFMNTLGARFTALAEEGHFAPWT